MFGVEGEEYEGLQLAVFMLNACLIVIAAMDVSIGPDSYCVISPETFKGDEDYLRQCAHCLQWSYWRCCLNPFCVCRLI